MHYAEFCLVLSFIVVVLSALAVPAVFFRGGK